MKERKISPKIEFPNDSFILEQNLDYKLTQKLGEGTFGCVYKATKEGKTFAIKKIKNVLKTNGISSVLIKEMTILQELRHENIIELVETRICTEETEEIENKKDFSVISPSFFIVYEYMPLDLYKYIKMSGKIPFEQAVIILHQIVSGLEFLHKKKVLHRDLKPQNILIDPETLKVKIGDFGMARKRDLAHLIKPNDELFRERYTPKVVTLWYRSPEILLGSDKYNSSVDIWSIGCIFFEMVTGKVLFKGNNEISQLNSIINVMGTIPDHKFKEFDPDINFARFTINKNVERLKSFIMNSDCERKDDVYNLLREILVLEPQKRIKIRSLVNHRIFDGIVEDFE